MRSYNLHNHNRPSSATPPDVNDSSPGQQAVHSRQLVSEGGPVLEGELLACSGGHDGVVVVERSRVGLVLVERGGHLVELNRGVRVRARGGQGGQEEGERGRKREGEEEEVALRWEGWESIGLEPAIGDLGQGGYPALNLAHPSGGATQRPRDQPRPPTHPWPESARRAHPLTPRPPRPSSCNPEPWRSPQALPGPRAPYGSDPARSDRAHRWPAPPHTTAHEPNQTHTLREGVELSSLAAGLGGEVDGDRVRDGGRV